APATSATKRADGEGDRDTGAEDSDQEVQAGQGAAEASCESDMTQGVSGEDLVSENHEIADQTCCERYKASRNESVAHEVKPEHHLQVVHHCAPTWNTERDRGCVDNSTVSHLI